MPDALAALPRPFFARHAQAVARDLLGKLVVRRLSSGEVRAGRIVETEAYHGHRDRASHAHRGLTARNRPMFGPPGHAYVYQVYGVWHCLNVVTMRTGFPAAVLIRALAPVALAPVVGYLSILDEREAAGPGKLGRALSIDKSHSGLDVVVDKNLWFADDGFVLRPREITRGPRIGIDYAGDCASRPWRFWLAGNPSVSK